MADDIVPLYTGVVRLKSYGKGDDVHVCRSKRPHLFVVTPDAVQLFSTADAGPALDEPPTLATLASVKTVSMVTRKQGPLGRMSRRTLLAGASDDEGPPPPPAASEGDPEELVEGQVFRLGVALNQVLGVQVVPGKPERLKVWYQPNRPSKKGSMEEQTMQVLRSMLRSMDVTRWGSSAAAGPPPLPPHANAHHFTIVTESPQEALAVKEEIERAQKQLALAVLWLSEGLPLRGASSVTLLSVGPGTASTSSSAAASGAPAFVIPFPGWNAELDLPPEVSGALASPGSRRSVSTVVRAYLSTPLGPATADIPLLALVQSAAEGSAPLATPAVLQDPPEPGSPLRPARRWQIMLQWRAVKGEPLLPPVTVRGGGGGGGSVAGGVERSGGSGTGSLAAGGNSPVVSEGLGPREQGATRFGRERRDLVPAGGARTGAGSMAVLVGLAALSGATAVARRVRNQLARLRGGGGAGTVAPPGAPQPWHRWRLVLLEVSIERETERPRAAMPPVKRALSVSAPPSSAAATAVSSSATPLPHHIELLARQYPTIITEDIARRFIVGLGSETKAFSALSAMALWITENRLSNIVSSPQPAFAAMKRHYPHGFPGWSTLKDCLVEVEAMGAWPRSYTCIAAEGVSEQAMLEHLLFVYQFAFARLDARPLPDGKTVKIVDLEGLSMGDLRTPGFKLITRVGAMLAMNFPQRSARVFLVNAPGWWAVAWKLVSPMVPPRVRAQMSLHGSSKGEREAARRAMLEWINEDVLPAAYGGKNEKPMAEWPLEKEMAAYVEELNRKANGGGDSGDGGDSEEKKAEEEEVLPTEETVDEVFQSAEDFPAPSVAGSEENGN